MMGRIEGVTKWADFTDLKKKMQGTSALKASPWTCMCSQVSSIDMVLALGARGCEFESRQSQCSLEN